ncbi:signal transduction histidine kinase [Friedmanniella endophytica]|uniref:histidine kinase n=1 Tax=Microlunatus kandeliicorticis TaxID=1759536 RepID=A0A7W3P521_9ACTN|nr:sensor histidine kinase [Microlunatus kandeliicorticis]MBA8793425.1 signal transduction histidine kinase [Microlunatus kandeliicorticis]
MTSTGRPRRLLLDVPLGVLVGLLTLVSAAMATAGGPTPDDRLRPFPTTHRGGGPPWFGGRGPDAFWTTPSWPLLGCVIVLAAAVAVRRVRPRAGYLIAVAAGAGTLLLGAPLGPVMLGPALTLLALARAVPPRRWVGWVGLLVPFVWCGFVAEPRLGLTDPAFWSALLFGIALMVLPALIGLVLRNRREARERTRELELRRSVSEERLRMAREVHDVVGHSLSVITMQAGVALHLLDRRPEQVETSLQAIRTTSRNALDELRATLAVFRGQPDGPGLTTDAGFATGAGLGPALRPTAGLARLDDLVTGYRAAGRRVELDGVDQVRDPDAGLPAAVDLAAYRIVQESLTNVARHTTSATARVGFSRLSTPTGDALVVEIADDGPPVRPTAGSDGTGLAGMAERARALGGRLEAGPQPGGGFRVRAELPVPSTTGPSTGPAGDRSPGTVGSDAGLRAPR